MTHGSSVSSKPPRPERASTRRGMSLVDTLVASALFVVVFLGIVAAFHLSVDIVTNNKSRAGAVAIADERMEYIRSLPYTSIGTQGGIPSGAILQSETVLHNGITYTLRTLVLYADDPKDGLDVADTNGIVVDYRIVKVDVAWEAKTGTRHIVLVSRFSPPTGMESLVPGGTLRVTVNNAALQPVVGAAVRVTNASTSPAVDTTVYTNLDGTITILGAPAGAGYHIVVSNPGYSTDQTYDVTAGNTNPNPGNLSVSEGHTTSATFSIDVLGTKTIQTWTQILDGSWNDTFGNDLKIATSTNISVSGGEAALTDSSSPGEIQSIAIQPADLNVWQTLVIDDTQPVGTSISYRVYDSGGTVLIPDAQLPGNAAGFSAGSVDLSGISTSTYPGLRVGASLLGDGVTSPAIDTWTVSYTYGPQPLPNIAFSIVGAKTIGSGPGGTIYKYDAASNTGAGASVTIPSLEWDNYTVSIASATGYDIASACNPQPESLAPGASMTTRLFLAPNTANSLLVEAYVAANGTLLPGATAVLSAPGYTATSTTDWCGQAFFSGLSSVPTYTLTVTAPGFLLYTDPNISVSGAVRTAASLAQ